MQEYGYGGVNAANSLKFKVEFKRKHIKDAQKLYYEKNKEKILANLKRKREEKKNMVKNYDLE